MPTKPAPADADRKLFENCPPEVRELNKKARKELRDQARKTYFDGYVKRQN